MAVTNAVPHDQILVSRTSSRELRWESELRHSLQLDPRDLTVQVKLSPMGCWHRKAIGGKQTACGITLGSFASRDESYLGELCEDGCFSRHELHELARLADNEDALKDP